MDDDMRCVIERVRRWPRLAALAAGSLMPFAFSPFDEIWLALLALAMLYWIARDCTSCTHPAWIGFAFGFGWFGFGAWWLAPTFHTYGHLPWPVAGLCVGLVGAALALFAAAWIWLACRLACGSAWFAPTFAISAVFEEWLRGHLFTGLPWTALGNILLDTPVIGWGAYLGVYGLALFPALLAASLVESLGRKHRIVGAAGMIIAIAWIVAAPAIRIHPDAMGMGKTAALIQGNIPQDKKWDAAFVRETMRRYAALSARAHADLIVWPEAAVPFFLARAPGWEDWLRQQVRHWRTPLLFGGLKAFADGSAQNGIFALSPQSARLSFAGKQHLVPFGEYVPGWIPFLHTLVPEIADFRPADDDGVLIVDGVAYGSLVCYESLFPEQARARVLAGAQVLVNVTNDAWYGHSPAAWQHMQAARMRAVETGRYVLRAANTGVTVIIAPDGSIRAGAPWWKTTLLEGKFHPISQLTPYVRWGDWPLLIGLFILIPPLLRGGWRR